MTTGATRPPVVMLANDPWDSQWRRKQQLAVRLAAGRRVYYLDPPFPALDFVRGTRSLPGWLRAPYQERVDPSGVHVVRGTVGFPGERFAGAPQLLNARLQRRWARACLRGPLARSGVRTPVVICYWPLLHPLHGLDAQMLIYDAIDDYAALSRSRAVRTRLETAMGALAGAADLTVATAPALVRRLAPHARRLEFLPHGVDIGCFHPEAWRDTPFAPLRELPGIKAAFHGTLDRRIDRETLAALARAGITLLLAGETAWSRAEMARLQACGDVRYFGLLPQREAAALVSAADVGIIPYRPLPGMESAQTLKRLEFYACGLPVVATDMDPYREFAGEIALAAGPDQFVRAVRAAPERFAPARERRLAIAAENTWEERARRFAELLAAEEAQRSTFRPAAVEGSAPC